MKKKVFVFFITILFACLLYSQENNESNNQIWKRHFFDLSIMGGPSIYYNPFLPFFGAGGLVGISFGYQYAFTPYFAFGPGATGLLSITICKRI